MQQLGRLAEKTVVACGYLAAGFVVAMMLLTLADVVMRYALHQPPTVADEFGGYLVVATSFLGLGYTWYAKGHVRITALVSNLPQKVANWLRVATLILALLFTIMMVQQSWLFLMRSFAMNMASSSIYRFPLQGPQSTIVIGLILLCLAILTDILRAVARIRSGERVE